MERGTGGKGEAEGEGRAEGMGGGGLEEEVRAKQGKEAWEMRTADKGRDQMLKRMVCKTRTKDNGS
jgi:hypothetical protein